MKFGQCAYCLSDPVELTDDHVLATAIYPEDTPANIRKPIAPSCVPCNRWFSKIEREIVEKFGLCFGLDDARAAGLASRVARAVDPTAARSDRDARHRAGRRARILREARKGKEVSELLEQGVGIVPGFGREEPGAVKELLAATIDQEHIVELGVKLVKGMTYVHLGRPIPQGYTIRVFLEDPETGDSAFAGLQRTIEAFGPGFSVTTARTNEDPFLSFMAFKIWNRLNIYATVLPWEPGDPGPPPVER